MARPMQRAAGEVPMLGTPAFEGGGPPAPARAVRVFDNGVLAMAIFLATEVMLFAGLVSAFLILRAGADVWPPPGQPRLPVAITGLNTCVLLASAWTMSRAVGATRRAERRAMLRWLAATAALGATFLAVQGAEWIALLRDGLRASSTLYAASFYTVIGCHGVHVAVAVLTLGVLLASAWRAATAAECRTRVEVCRLYWWFVVAVWPVLYVLVYLA
jgi:cytochrome c oxidase subunit 3